MSAKLNRMKKEHEEAAERLMELMKDFVYTGHQPSQQERYDIYRILSRLHKLDQLIDMEKRYQFFGTYADTLKGHG